MAMTTDGRRNNGKNQPRKPRAQRDMIEAAHNLIASKATAISPEICQRAYDYALLGATMADVADRLGVKMDTVDRWIHEDAAFGLAFRMGKQWADDNVVQSLFRRAMGYEQPAIKLFWDKDKGQVVEHSVMETVLPDVTAQIFWLKNRQRDKWTDVYLGGKGDGVGIAIQINLG
jgi:hypothetical protein